MHGDVTCLEQSVRINETKEGNTANKDKTMEPLMYITWLHVYSQSLVVGCTLL